MLKIGDIVRFLNSVGGGVVTGISGNVAMVEDSDGFAVPVPVGECVVVAGADLDAGEAVAESSSGDMINLSLAFVRTEGGYDVTAVNSSAYNVYMQVIVKVQEGGGFRLKFAGELSPGERRYVFSMRQGEMSLYCRKYTVRILPFKYVGDFILKPYYEVTPSLDPKVFANDALYKDIFSLGVRALEVPLVFGDDSCCYDHDFSRMKTVPKEEDRPRPVVRKRTMWPVEEDLHADAILETTAGMEPRDILAYQKEYVRGVMRRYYGKVRGGEVVFIHGKGDGVLKRELRRILREEFPKCSVQDAPFSKYGSGATSVLF